MSSFFFIFIIMKGLVIFIICLTSLFGHSQALEKKNAVLEIGWGFPPLNALTSGAFNSSFSNIDYVNIGTFVISTEIFLTDRIGLNLTGMYSYSRSEESNTFVEFNESNGTSNSVDYIKTVTRNRFKFIAGPHFHLYRSENLDTYLGLGFGMNKSYRNTKYTIQPPEVVDGFFNFDAPDVFPVAFRVSYGMRYFINEYWALKAEFGLGGPIFNFSISTKIL